MLPQAVMLQAQEEFLDWQGSGMSVMEISHRGPEFLALTEKILHHFRLLLNIPSSYEILLLQGGAQTQFAAAPLNLANEKKKAAYAVTGIWSQKAQLEASRYIEAVSVLGEGVHDKSIPNPNTWQALKDLSYFYFCDNETIQGLEFFDLPTLYDAPIICDMTSSILTKPLTIENYGMIIASSQKNLGAAGVTLVIIHQDLLKRTPMPFTPTILQYQAQLATESMYNTPNTYSWYLMNLVLEWTLQQGGVIEMDRRAKERSGLLYQYIDQSDFYHNVIDPKFRSRLNVSFNLRDEKQNVRFLEAANQAGLKQLKGHKLFGGMRASLYNAMPLEGVHALIDFMKDFAG